MKLLGHSYKIGNMGHPRTSKSKIANLMKLVNFAFFSSQGNIFELKNVKGNLIAPNSNRWCLFKENPLFQDDQRRLKKNCQENNFFFAIDY